jgi:hypothetical protein
MVDNRKKFDVEAKQAGLSQCGSGGTLGLAAEAYRELSLRERLLADKARIQREASAKIRKINNSLVELENTEAEDVVARAREVLNDVG